MKKEQWTVLGLLVALLGLEVVRSQNVRGFFTGTWTNFQMALNNASNIIPSGLPTLPGMGGGIAKPTSSSSGSGSGGPVGSNIGKAAKPGQKPSGGITGGGAGAIPSLNPSNYPASFGKVF